MTDYQTPGPVSLTVDLACVGDVRLTTAATTTTTVDVRPRDAQRAADVRASEQVEIEHIGGILRITAHRSWRAYSLWGNGGAIDIEVTLPTGSEVSVDLAMGRVDAGGALGACRIKTAMGNIRLDDTGPLQVSTSYGDILVGAVDGAADLSTGSGSLRVTRIDADAVIKNSNGDTRIGAVIGALEVKAANGDISVAQAHDSVTAKTANGSVRIAEIRRGSVSLSTACGDVEVGIHDGTAAWVDASSKCGTVRRSLEAADSPGDAEQTVEVRARTSYGDISIHRAG
jgi:DUF4097 and DUF4098 domain-containing protein YvlB|nr:hypothetical protein [Aeromicrobium sp.]